MKPSLHIIGGRGRGELHVVAKLARRFNIPAYDLDDLCWDHTALHYGIRADSEQQDPQFAEVVAQEGWIIEGV